MRHTSGGRDIQLLQDYHSRYTENTGCILWVFLGDSDASLLLLGEFGFAQLFFAGVHKDWQKSKGVDKTIRRVPSEQIHHDPYEEEVLHHSCEPYAQPTDP